MIQEVSGIASLPGVYYISNTPDQVYNLYQAYKADKEGGIPSALSSYEGLSPQVIGGIANLYTIPKQQEIFRQFSPAQIAEANYEITSSGLQPKAPPPTPPLEELLKNIGVDSSYFNMYTQGRAPSNYELSSGDAGGPTKDLGEQYSDLGRPSFLGFTGDLGATTGRTIRVDSNTSDNVIRRAETYQDVLNAYRRQKSQEGA